MKTTNKRFSEQRDDAPMRYWNCAIGIKFFNGNRVTSFNLDVLVVAPNKATADFYADKYTRIAIGAMENPPSEKFEIRVNSKVSNLKQIISKEYLENLENLEKERKAKLCKTKSDAK